MKKLSCLFFICLFLYCCKGDQSRVNEAEATKLFSSDLPEDFLSFYMQFHTDSLFQIDHIVFPLKMKRDSSAYLAEEWSMHRPFSDQDGEYEQSFVNMNGLIIEHIISTNQIFRMERRFVKSDGSYNLIYYHVNNAFTNSKDWEKDTSS